MPTISEVTERPVSGLNHIDALLGSAMPWNYIGRNTIYFSFMLDAGGDPDGSLHVPGTLAAFNATQQEQARAVLAYVAQVTGIAFTEVSEASWADLHFANADLTDGYTSQSARHVGYTTQGTQAANLQVDSWVYLDAYDDAYDNLAPLPGGSGYEAIVHEVGHALGLRHPGEGNPTLPAGDQLGQDNSATTIMSENPVGGPYTSFNAYDIAALQWLYGGDGLGGNWGVGTQGRSVVGSFAADMLVGGAGNDKLSGAAGNDWLIGNSGIDTAVFAAGRSSYLVNQSSNGFTVAAQSGNEGTDTLAPSVERALFGDGTRMAFDIEGHGGQAYRLYKAAFDRTPDLPGLGYHITDLDNGTYITIVSAHFIESPEFLATYGALNNEQYVRQLYLNVLDREPDAPGLAYHVNNLQTTHTRADVLAGFSESPENKANVIGLIQDGIVYTL